MTVKRLLRMTPQRQVILEELRKAPRHPTADELYEKVKKKVPRISLGTVYRNLDILSSQGLIRRIETGGNQKRFDGSPDPHYHVRCIRCGALEDVEIGSLPSPHEILQDAKGYEIRGLQLEFTGLCPKCRKKEGK